MDGASADDLKKRCRELAEALQRNEEACSRFRELLPQPYLAVDENGRLREVNHAWTEFFGLQRDEALGRPLVDFFSPVSRGELEKYLAGLRREGTISGVDFEMRHRDGSVRHVSMNGRVEYGPDRDQKRYHFLVFDLTEEKLRMEETILASEQKFRTLFESAEDGIFIHDLKGGIIDLNRAAHERLGYAREELLGGRIERFTSPEYRGRLSTYLQDMEKGERGVIESFHLRKDGTEMPVEINSRLAEIAGEKLVISIVRDITARQQVHQELRRSHEYLDRIINGMSDALMIISPDFRIRDVNRKFLERYGAEREEVIGRCCYEVSHRRHRPCDQEHACPLRSVVKDRTPLVVEHRHEDRHGTEQIVELYCYPLFDEQGEVEKVVEVIHDITDRRRSEEQQRQMQAQLRQAQKMEAIGTLAGGIAHDFNNILVPIFGNVELIKELLPPAGPASQMLDEVLASANRAKDLVRQILSFSRRSELHFGPVQPHLIVGEALKLLRASIPATIDIRSTLDRDCGYVLADPTQLHQIVMNLCTNAAQAMEETGGTMSVDLERVFLAPDDRRLGAAMDSGLYAKLVVRDTGCGIEPGHLEKVFDPYFTTKTAEKGSGLGLAVVAGIIKKHHGTITVHSEPGTGTVFEVYFPLTEVLPVTDNGTGDELPGGREHLLVVDDEKSVLTIMRELLQRLGYRVTIASCSSEALEVFQARPHDFDLVLTDQAMPGLPGSELATRMLRLRPGLPVILSTGYSSVVSREEALRVGISEYLLKPVETGTLALTIRRLLNGNRKVDAGSA